MVGILSMKKLPVVLLVLGLCVLFFSAGWHFSEVANRNACDDLFPRHLVRFIRNENNN